MVCWFHDDNDEPELLYHEINNERYELRKIEVYKDGSFSMASEDYSFGGAELSMEVLPEIEDINCDSQFKAKIITREEFEEVWADYNHFLKIY